MYHSYDIFTMFLQLFWNLKAPVSIQLDSTEKKEIMQVSNNMAVSKWCRIFIFWSTIPLNEVYGCWESCKAGTDCHNCLANCNSSTTFFSYAELCLCRCFVTLLYCLSTLMRLYWSSRSGKPVHKVNGWLAEHCIGKGSFSRVKIGDTCSSFLPGLNCPFSPLQPNQSDHIAPGASGVGF